MSHDEWKSKITEELNHHSGEGELHINPQDKMGRRGEYDYRVFRDKAKTVFSARITHLPTGETITDVTHNWDDFWPMVERMETILNERINQVLSKLGIKGADAAAVKWIGKKPVL